MSQSPAEIAAILDRNNHPSAPADIWSLTAAGAASVAPPRPAPRSAAPAARIRPSAPDGTTAPKALAPVRSWADATGDEFARAVNAIHESGHAVLAVLAGAEIRECVASADGGHVEFFGHDPDREAGVGWAGPFAELLFRHGDAPPPDAVAEAFADLSDEDRALVRGGLHRHVEPDVRAAMPAIRRLAAQLFRVGRAAQPDVMVALGVRPGVDLETVRWAFRNRTDPRTIRPAGVAA